MPTYAPGVLTPKSVPDTLTVAGREFSGFSRLEPETAMTLRLRMIEAASECGCRWGAGVGGGALTAYLAISVVAPLARQVPTTFAWSGAAAVSIGGILLGKAFGTFRAQRAFRDATAEFERLVSARPARD